MKKNLQKRTLVVLLVVVAILLIGLPTVYAAPTEELFISVETDGEVRTMLIEEYLIGVLAAEMPASFHLEALKALAVTARSYTLEKHDSIMDSSKQNFVTVDEMKDMWGSDFEKNYNKIKEAVNSTSYEIMIYEGKVIDSMYFSMSNGLTENPKNLWGNGYPYLKTVSSPWEKELDSFQSTKIMTYKEISDALGFEVNSNTNFEILEFNETGRVQKIKIGDEVYKGKELRSKLKLRSTDFEILKQDSQVIISTKGYGHGVGLSQWGAQGAAKEGWNYKKILNHYYTNVEIKKYIDKSNDDEESEQPESNESSKPSEDKEQPKDDSIDYSIKGLVDHAKRLAEKGQVRYTQETEYRQYITDVSKLDDMTSGDCSSFVASMFKSYLDIELGTATVLMLENYGWSDKTEKITKTTYDYGNGWIGTIRRIEDLDDLEPGDILLRRHNEKGHVGIYAGNDHQVDHGKGMGPRYRESLSQFKWYIRLEKK